MGLFSKKTEDLKDSKVIKNSKLLKNSKTSKNPKPLKNQKEKNQIQKVLGGDFNHNYPTKNRFGSIIISPRITEKITHLNDKHNVYAFNIHQDADKAIVGKAVREIYKVNPLKINIVKTRAKKVFVRGRRGVKQGHRKAYVFLKKGDKIEFV